MLKRFRQPEAIQADPTDEYVIPNYADQFFKTTGLKREKSQVAAGAKRPVAANFTAAKHAELEPGWEGGPNDPLVIKGIIRQIKPEPEIVTDPAPAISYPSTDLKERTGGLDLPSSDGSYASVANGNSTEPSTPLIVETEAVAEPHPAVVTTQTLTVPRPPKLKRLRPKLPSLELGKKAETFGGKFRGFGKRILAAADVLDPRPLLEKAKNSSTPNLFKRLGSIAARDLNEAMLASSNMGMGLLNPNYLTKTKPTTSERLQKLSIAPGAVVEPEPVVEPSAEDELQQPETAPTQEEHMSRRLRLRKGLATLAIVGAVITPKINTRQRLSSAWSDIKNFSRFTDSNAADQTVSVAVEPEQVADPQPAAVTTQTYVVPRPPKAWCSTPKMPSFELGKKAETFGRKFRGFGKTTMVAAKVLDPRPQLEKTKTPAMQDRYKKLGSAISALATDFRPALYPHEKQALSTGWKKASSAIATDFRPALYPHEKQALLNAWDKTRKAYYLGIARVSNGLSSGFENLYKD